MTEAFKSIVDHVASLPDEEQDFVAAIIQDELDSNERWEKLFAHPKSEELLEKLAAKAIADDDAGLTTPLDLDSM